MRSWATQSFMLRNGMMTEFPHLYPAACQLAALSAEDRIHRIRADRWISYPRAEAALEELIFSGACSKVWHYVCFLSFARGYW